MDFLMLPPEINSARIYSGPGSHSLTAAAKSWNNLATDLEQTALDYRAVVLNMLDFWYGPSSSEMFGAALPFIVWMQNTASNAKHTAQAADNAAAAYNLARNESVHPAVVAANRSQLLTLVSTNIFGQNSPAIAANETMYGQMWVQDIAAMLGYHASATSNTVTLQHFTDAPTTAVPAAARTTWLQFLQTLFPGFTAGDPLGNLAELLVSPLGLAIISSAPTSNITGITGILALLMLADINQSVSVQAANAAHPIIVPPTLTTVSLPPPAAESVKASTGTGQSLGRMRVPPNWALPQQESKPSPAAPLPANQSRNALGLPIIPFVPVASTGRGKKPRATDPDTYPIGLPIKMTPPRNLSGG